MSFTDQQPFEVTQRDIDTKWGCKPSHVNFRCAWCGHAFVVGDVARWVYTNGGGPESKGIGGNPFICAKCDGPRDEILSRLRGRLAAYRAAEFWWFRRGRCGHE